MTANAFRQCGTPVEVEETGYDHDKNRRPDIFAMINNIPTFIDVGIVHPSAKSYRREKRRLEIARRYEQGKIRKYTDMAMDNNGVIIPFIIESNGGFGETANYVTADVAALANQDALAFVPSELKSSRTCWMGSRWLFRRETHWPFAARWKCR